LALAPPAVQWTRRGHWQMLVPNLAHQGLLQAASCNPAVLTCTPTVRGSLPAPQLDWMVFSKVTGSERVVAGSPSLRGSAGACVWWYH
jgi:hypothetical protein